MNRTGIEWCDWTWNPIVGCSPASAGCANCYAAAISKRFHLPWGSAHFMPERLTQPAKVRKPGRVFVCSMSDMGHETVKPEWRQAVYEVMQVAYWHTFIVLTKRPGPWMRAIPEGTLCGVTVENDEALWRVSTLYRYVPTCAMVVSVEPMLGPLSLRGMVPLWVIAGPETGPKARRCEDAWIDALAAESPYFFDKRKNWTRREWPIETAARGAATPDRGGVA